jgi:hypothetical protein
LFRSSGPAREGRSRGHRRGITAFVSRCILYIITSISAGRFHGYRCALDESVWELRSSPRGLEINHSNLPRAEERG